MVQSRLPGREDQHIKWFSVCAVYLEGRASVAVGSGESRVTDAALVQAVPVSPTVVLARRADVEVLHGPLHVRVLLVEAEAHRPEEEEITFTFTFRAFGRRFYPKRLTKDMGYRRWDELLYTQHDSKPNMI